MFRFAFLSLLLAVSAFGSSVSCPDPTLNISTKRVVVIDEEIRAPAVFKTLAQLGKVAAIPGDILVIINSPGGSVSDGQLIIDALRRTAQLTKSKLVCIGDHSIHSMAFAIMSYCDVRLMTPGSTALVHNMSIYMNDRATARKLREIAEDLERTEAPYRLYQATLMGLTLKDYDLYASMETYWTAKQLLKMKYLQGICELNPKE